MVTGAFSGLTLLAFYVAVLRHDLSVMPVAVGTQMAMERIGEALHPAYSGAVMGALIGAVVALVATSWLAGLLRRAQTPAASALCAL